MIQKCKYRPIIVEAVKFEKTEKSIIETIQFILGIDISIDIDYQNIIIKKALKSNGLEIPINNFEFKVKFGNYIVKGANSTFQSYTPEDFKASFKVIN